MEGDLGVHARHQGAVGVGREHFDPDRARGRINRLGGAVHRALEDAPGELRRGHVGRQADAMLGRATCGHFHEDARRLRGGDGERAWCRAGAAGGDQVADVHGPPGHHAVEGRHDLLEADQVFEPAHVRLAQGYLGLRRFQLGQADVQLRFLLVGLLQRHDPFGRGGLKSHMGDPGEFGRGLGQFHVGLQRLQFGPGDHEFLVEVGRVNRGQDVAGLDVVADIEIPYSDVAVDPREKLGFIERAAYARQRQRAVRAAGLDLDDVDHRRLFERPADALRQRRPGRFPLAGAESETDDQHGDRDHNRQRNDPAGLGMDVHRNGNMCGRRLRRGGACRSGLRCGGRLWRGGTRAALRGGRRLRRGGGDGRRSRVRMALGHRPPPSPGGTVGGARCTSRKTEGTKTRVAKVAKSRPPMTARASGAFCSPPSPMPRAMGIMPRIMAPAVIRTGRMRV